MKRSSKGLAILLLAVILVVTACSGNPSGGKAADGTNSSSSESNKGGNLIVAIKDDPKTFNPIYAGDGISLRIAQALFSPLFSVHEGKKTFLLAESLTPSADLKKYTLKLRQGLKWHDGQNLTSDDVVFTLNSLLDEKQHSYFRSLFVYEGTPMQVKRVDDLTVDFLLPQASASFESGLAQIFPIPKHIFEGEADIEKSAKNNQPVGSGPFKFKEYRAGEYVAVERSDQYFSDKSKLNSLTFRVSKDANAGVLALQNGEINMLQIEPQNYNKVKEAGTSSVFMFPSGGVTTLVFNANIELMQNKKVRQAIVQGLNQSDLITAGFDSTEYAEPAGSIFSPGTLYQSNKGLNKYPFDPEAAKSLLKEAGAEGVKLRFAYFSASKAEENMSLYVQQRLKEIGIQIDLLPLDGAVLGKKSRDKDNKDYDLSFGGYNMGSEPDSYKVLYLSDGSYNQSHAKNPEADLLWLQAAVETDSAKRAALYEKIQDIEANEITTFPIAYSKSIIAVDNRFGGVEEAVPAPIVLVNDYSKLYQK